MALNLIMHEQEDLTPRITVFGVGGAGGNAVNNMIDKALEGVEFVVANTDAQALQQSRSRARIQLGIKVTEGLGAGARPSVGAAAAEEAIEEIVDHLAGAHMCFITAGMGGGTGTGAAPIIAQAARELGVLTVGVVTKPFQFEGARRMRQAEEGVELLQKVVDTLIIIPNQNLFRLANEKTTFTEAFALADDVLYQGVKGVTDLMVRPGLINLDFADVRAVMDEMGKAMMGTGEAEGEDRARQAAEKAIANPLLDEISLNGAKGVLINVTGGHDLTLFELDEAASLIREKVDADANIIVGSTLDPSMEGVMRVSVVATGIEAAAATLETPVPRRRLAEPLQPPASVRPESFEVPAAAVHDTGDTLPAAAERTPAPEPTLFDPRDAHPQRTDRYDPVDRAQRTAAQDPVQDDLPPPAYAARQRAEAVRQQAPHPAAPHQPAARAPGTASPEALVRLRHAVASGNSRDRAADHSAQAAPVARAGMAPGADRARFGINSLLHRMTGQAEASGHGSGGHQGRATPQGHAPAAEPAPRAAAAPRPQPRVARADPAQQPAARNDRDPEQDRIEIPAFLRRQAN
ncbi:MAG: cell division protein FtsZ [Alkalilacustris sp.]